MIVFQVSINFDPVKEILKIFQFEPEQKKTCHNERVKKLSMTLTDFVAVNLF